MRFIEKIADQLHEELEGAKEYAEKYIENKAKGNSTRALRFKDMASDELRHAQYIHDFSVADMEDIKKVYTLTDQEEEAWNHICKHYAEHSAIIRMMLA